MEFFRQEYWDGLPFPPPGDLPDPGIKPVALEWQVDSLALGHLGSPHSINPQEHLILQREELRPVKVKVQEQATAERRTDPSPCNSTSTRLLLPQNQCRQKGGKKKAWNPFTTKIGINRISRVTLLDKAETLLAITQCGIKGKNKGKFISFEHPLCVRPGTKHFSIYHLLLISTAQREIRDQLFS